LIVNVALKIYHAVCRSAEFTESHCIESGMKYETIAFAHDCNQNCCIEKNCTCGTGNSISVRWPVFFKHLVAKLDTHFPVIRQIIANVSLYLTNLNICYVPLVMCMVHYSKIKFILVKFAKMQKWMHAVNHKGQQTDCLCLLFQEVYDSTDIYMNTAKCQKKASYFDIVF